MTKITNGIKRTIKKFLRSTDSDISDLDPIREIDLPGTLARGQLLPLYNSEGSKSEATGICKAVTIGDVRMYLHVSEYPDGKPGALNITLSKMGDSLRVYEILSETATDALKFGMPIERLIESWEHTRFEPQGITTDTEIPFVSSICDYIAKWFKKRYCEGDNNEPKRFGK